MSVFLGDSITYFWQQNGWQPWAEFYNPVGAVNTGWPGDWTTTLIDKLSQGLIDQYTPRLAVQLIGTNDLGQGGSEDSVVTNILTIIDIVKSKAHGSKILLLGILPRSGIDVHMKIKNVNARVSSFADGQTVYFLDMESQFSASIGALLPGMSEDGVHLTALGYNTWASTMNPLFFSLLNNGELPTTTQATPRCTNAVFQGDSITDFFDSDGSSSWNEYYAPLGAINTGVSGDWTYDTIDRISDNGIINGLNARVAVLKIGTNDLSGNKEELIVAGNIRIIISLIQDRNPGVKVLLLGILPRNGVDVHTKVRRVNELISRYADGENVRFLDMEAQFSTGLETVIPELFTDELHLAARGYQVWTETMNPLFFELLEAPYCGVSNFWQK